MANEDHAAEIEMVEGFESSDAEEAKRFAQSMTDFGNVIYMSYKQDGYSDRPYRVKPAPQIGDFVSYAFNGDYYPDGEIVAISASFRRIKTESGNVYWRNKEAYQWKYEKTWSMVKGHHDERNPSF